MKNYKPIISLSKNERGIWDLDTCKGCSSGMQENERGCYGDCYSARSAKIYGYDFSKTVFRHFKSIAHVRQTIKKINKIDMPFIRMGCSGDPSENWAHTLSILNLIKNANKEIVIITKHWQVLTDLQLIELQSYNVCINTSVSALDNPDQLSKCLFQHNKLKGYCKSVLRIVSCDFNKNNPDGNRLSLLQDELFKNELFIDTVFRPSKNNNFLLQGIINVNKSKFLNSIQLVSKFNRKTYIGGCKNCTEKCGIFKDKLRTLPEFYQPSLFDNTEN